MVYVNQHLTKYDMLAMGCTETEEKQGPNCCAHALVQMYMKLLVTIVTYGHPLLLTLLIARGQKHTCRHAKILRCPRLTTKVSFRDAGLCSDAWMAA